MMMQSEPSWPNFNFPFSALNPNTPYDQEIDLCGVNYNDFSCSFASPENSSVISNSNSYVQPIFSDEFFDMENFGDETHICSSMEGLENISSGDIEEIYEWINTKNDTDENENSSSPLLTMVEEELSPCLPIESSQNSGFSPLVFPGDEVEVDGQLSLLHLLRAYGEAMENGEKDLSEVIVKSISERSSPMGSTMERVAYNLFPSEENQGEYLRQESSNNLASAFKVLYQSLPNGRFAHLTALSAILESLPSDAETIRIVDFDMGEGIQWPPLIEALSRRHVEVRLTSIKGPEEESSTSSCWSFDDTKKRLLFYAAQYGVKLQVEENSIENLGSEMMRVGQGREWVVFNCMVGLPHMGRRRPRKSVAQFLKVAEGVLANFEGIVTFGDGETGKSFETCYTYASYFDNLVRHYQALFESLERNFPVYLAEARTAMESLFLAPLMSLLTWSKDWEEMKKGLDIRNERQLEGRKLSLESLAEAKQIVNERENSYNVKIERLREHEMVLQWKETPLVRVSTWM